MNWRSRGFRPRKKETGGGGGGAGGGEDAASQRGGGDKRLGENAGDGTQTTSANAAHGGGGSAAAAAPSTSAGGHLRHHIDATLGSGNLRAAVKLPAGEDYDEWLAVNTVDFYNAINLLYGLVAEFCTEATCPTMNAGPKYEYRWADGVRFKKPIECSAPKYVDYLFQWVENQVDNPELFPQTPGAVYTPQFRSVVKTILRRLFRVYAHIYHCHFREVCRLGAEAHLNTCFKHFVYFVQEFKLIDSNELAPLQEIISGIM